MTGPLPEEITGNFTGFGGSTRNQPTVAFMFWRVPQPDHRFERIGGIVAPQSHDLEITGTHRYGTSPVCDCEYAGECCYGHSR
jgi:hypothetical protein